MSEFGEPWKTYGNCDQHDLADGVRIYANPTSHDPSPWIADCGHSGAEERIAIADRIVACINACADIPTEALDRIHQCAPSLTINLTPELKAELQQALADANQSQIITLPAQVQYGPAPLRWRKEPPDEPGYYWVRFSADGEHGPSDLVEVAENESDGILYFHHCAKARRKFCGMGLQFITQCEWAGPIEPPPAE